MHFICDCFHNNDFMNLRHKQSKCAWLERGGQEQLLEVCQTTLFQASGSVFIVSPFFSKMQSWSKETVRCCVSCSLFEDLFLMFCTYVLYEIVTRIAVDISNKIKYK